MWTRKPSPTNPQGQQQHKPRSNLQIKSETVPAQRHNLDAERHPVPEINPPASRRALGEIIPESPRDIISESWAASSRSTRAASSESAGRGGSHPRELPPFAPASDDRNNALAQRTGMGAICSSSRWPTRSPVRRSRPTSATTCSINAVRSWMHGRGSWASASRRTSTASPREWAPPAWRTQRAHSLLSSRICPDALCSPTSPSISASRSSATALALASSRRAAA